MKKDMPKKAELEFPVEWTFRIIVEGSVDSVRMELAQVFHKFAMAPELKDGKVSAGGRYQTLMAEVTIPDRLVFEALPEALGKVSGVKMVL